MGVPERHGRRNAERKRRQYKGKGEGLSWGKGIWQVGAGSGNSRRRKSLLEASSRLERRSGDQESGLGQYTPDIFAVDAERSGDNITKVLSNERFCGDSCSKKVCGHRRCEKRAGKFAAW